MRNDIVLRIFDLCREKGVMISVCESLTGGLVADTLIGYAGASEFFYEGIVAYSNEAKIRRLFVNAETLEKFGAVSRETAAEMAKGLYEHGAELSEAERGGADIENETDIKTKADIGTDTENKINLKTDKKKGCNVKRVAAAVSTTGIAGPGGGSVKKPVGLTYIGLCADGKTQTREFIFEGSREEIRILAADKALEFLEYGLKNCL
jgi:PncC family amidohydrolase